MVARQVGHWPLLSFFLSHPRGVMSCHILSAGLKLSVEATHNTRATTNVEVLANLEVGAILVTGNEKSQEGFQPDFYENIHRRVELVEGIKLDILLFGDIDANVTSFDGVLKTVGTGRGSGGR